MIEKHNSRRDDITRQKLLISQDIAERNNAESRQKIAWIIFAVSFVVAAGLALAIQTWQFQIVMGVIAAGTGLYHFLTKRTFLQAKTRLAESEQQLKTYFSDATQQIGDTKYSPGNAKPVKVYKNETLYQLNDGDYRFFIQQHADGDMIAFVPYEEPNYLSQEKAFNMFMHLDRERFTKHSTVESTNSEPELNQTAS